MTNELNVKLLADCKEHIPALAKLWYDELGKKWVPKASVKSAIETYTEHCNRKETPLTLVAEYNGQPIGMVSLRDNDGIRPDLAPWLGSLIVHPDYRQMGFGELLVEKTLQQALKMGFTRLYLFVLDATLPEWYKQLGWMDVAKDHYHQHPVTVMEIALAP